jgi:hypothetical protein
MNTSKHDEVSGWLAGRLPSDWFEGPPTITIDREEIQVIGRIPAPEQAEGASDAARAATVAGRIKQFREDTRQRRIEIARELEHASRRKVAWGVECEDTKTVFSNVSVPVMTRLRQPQRLILDTLVEAGVARSRSHALAWCVRLVGEHSAEWLTELRSALEEVERVRGTGPGGSGAGETAADATPPAKED